VALGLTTPAASARDVFVSPMGQWEARGTREDPCHVLRVLCDEGGVRPGDTVWLMAGTYPAPERAGQRVPFTSLLKGEGDRPIIVRAMPGSRVILDGRLVIRGAHTYYHGFEVTDSRFDPNSFRPPTVHPAWRAGVCLVGPGTRVINLHIHNVPQGVWAQTPAVGAEIYGCIIHDFGWPGPNRGHGHGIYAINESGTMRIVDNILFRGYGWNIHAYREAKRLVGLHLEGNICFAPGALIADDPKDNILAYSARGADRITLVRNVAYHTEMGGWRPNVRLGYYTKDNGTAVCVGNYIMGLRGLSLRNWKHLLVEGNTVWAPRLLLTVQQEVGERWVVDGNTYVCPAHMERFGVRDDVGLLTMTFAEYRKATGFDANSKLIEAERPTENFIFVRPNRYEPGRGHVAVFNWEEKEAVTVDLSAVLKKGARFVVHNVQDLYGKPVAEGTFDGNPVTLPMLKSKIAPDFDAFLVTSLTE